jgi:hypothetical protein
VRLARRRGASSSKRQRPTYLELPVVGYERSQSDQSSDEVWPGEEGLAVVVRHPRLLPMRCGNGTTAT